MLKAILWTRDYCGYCAMAKKELELRGYEIEERNKWVQSHYENWLRKSPVHIMSESEDFTNVCGDKVITLKVSLPQLDKGNLLNYYH